MLLDRAQGRAAFAPVLVALMLSVPAAFAQTAPDPTSPMAPLPDLGVAWPDLQVPDAGEGPVANATDGNPPRDEHRYNVVVKGADGLDLGHAFAGLSTLQANDGKPANAAQLDRRARADAQVLDTLLDAQGYYDGTVDTAVKPDGDRVVVTLTVTPGPRYRFGDVTVSGLEHTGGRAAGLRSAIGVEAGQPVDAAVVLAGEAALRERLAREGFPFATVPDPAITIDHATQTASFALSVDTGEEMRFGAIRVEGRRPPFGARHVQTIARFRPGQLYDQERVDDLRRALIATGLISAVTLKPVKRAQGTADIIATIERAPVHTVAGAVGYGTGEGLSIEASWQHRNLIVPEGAVTFRGVAGTKEQLLGATLRMGNFRRRDQALNASIVASHDRRPAYDARSLDVAGSLERQTNIIWQKTWTYSFGFELLASSERDYVATAGVRQRRTYLITALPGTIGYDGSDDLLNPTRGFRLAARVSPELSSSGHAFGYIRTQLDASAYQHVTGGVVLAGRARIGFLTGASRDSIAPSRLFYAGGGGSVRGFGYQEIGPRNAIGEPVGGRSLSELSIEARARFGNFGVVPFLDAGNIYTASYPKFTNMRIGTGIGVRYYSQFGPIRVDVGTPLARRPGEARIAVYVSLGQAFLKLALRWLAGIALLLLLLTGVTLWLADTGVGHRVIADRIARLNIKSGLVIRIGRIDGSIYGKSRLHDVRLLDSRGVFFESNDIALDWSPQSWLATRLDIESLTAPTATLVRLPHLKSTDQKGAILPRFDVHVGEFSIGRLEIGPAVTGRTRAGRLFARADVRRGRAFVDLKVFTNAGDRLLAKADVEPDRNTFDLAASVAAPSGGVIAAILKAARPTTLHLAGRGNWAEWHGTLAATASGTSVIDLNLSARHGRYDLAGALAPSVVTHGKLMRLSSPMVRVKANAMLANRRLDTHLALASPALLVGANGVIDLSTSSFRDMRVDARLVKPSALFPNMTGRDIRLEMLLDGAFRQAAFDYRLTAQRAAFDETGFEQVRAVGRGHFSRTPIAVPIKLTARRVTGVGDVAGGILGNLSIDGVLSVTAQSVTGSDLRLRSDRLTSRVTLMLDLTTGRYTVGLSGQLGRYLIPGLGIVEVKSRLQVVPGPAGRGTRVVGQGQVWVRRLDNSFLASLAGGLPHIETALERAPDGILHFHDLKLWAPAIRLIGNGYRRRDGSFHFEGAGTQFRYGPFRLKLDGRIERPKIDVQFARPLDALGLKAVRAVLTPNGQGFAWRAAGGSLLGQFTGNGAIVLPPGAPGIISVNALDVASLRARGQISSVPRGFLGRLAVTGTGITGDLNFAPAGTIQRINAHFAAKDAQMTGPWAVKVGRGVVDASVLLDPRGATVDANGQARGLRYAGLTLARMAASARLQGGNGSVTASIAGSRGRAFALQAIAQVRPGRIDLNGSGTIDGRPVKLDTTATVTREGAGWALAPTSVALAGGTARVNGRLGGGITAVEVTAAQVPLTVLDIAWPRLALGGTASGALSFSQSGNALPTGHADLRLRGLTRAGLVLSSRPADIGIAAQLTGGALAMRAVAASNGQTIGRAQARLAPIPASGSLMTRLSHAPLFAQLRYNGPADSLWRLTGIEAIDLSGPVAVGADITGTLDTPQIRGSVKSAAMRLESALTGTVLTGLKMAGNFGGSTLSIDNFAATAGHGTVSGRAAFSFSGAKGLAINILAQAENAELLRRDDISATVSGPLTIRSDGGPGTISGNVILDKSAFRLGQASAANAVPRLSVREVNTPEREEPLQTPAAPWQLDLKAVARNRLAVTGLGLDSEWRADLGIRGAVNAPIINGRADLVRGGYEFAGRRFDLSRGIIRFQGANPPDPVLDIQADANISNISATIKVTGTGQKPEIMFASVPALPQDELLSRLLFGTSITNLSAPEALQLAAAVASLRSGGAGLNPINAVRQAIGLDRLRILPADTTTGQKTSIAAGKYITRRTYVEVISDGAGYSATRIEFQITRWLSLLSTISTIGRQTATVRVSKDY